MRHTVRPSAATVEVTVFWVARERTDNGKDKYGVAHFAVNDKTVNSSFEMPCWRSWRSESGFALSLHQ